MIRSATSDDNAACVAIIGEHPLWDRYGYTATAAGRDLAGACERAELWVCDVDGVVVAFCWVVPRGSFGRSDYLRLIGVAKSAAGDGLGGRLLRHAEANAGRGGMSLLVSDFNTAAQRFYERQGYAQVGRLPGYVLSDVDELIYWKPAADRRPRSEEAGPESG